MGRSPAAVVLPCISDPSSSKVAYVIKRLQAWVHKITWVPRFLSEKEKQALKISLYEWHIAHFMVIIFALPEWWYETRCTYTNCIGSVSVIYYTRSCNLFFGVRWGNRLYIYLSLVCGLQILSVTNNTECAKLLEEIKCAHCSPHAQNLFHSPEKGETPERELTLPYLCRDYCKEFYYTCRGHIPGKTYNKIRG